MRKLIIVVLTLITGVLAQAQKGSLKLSIQNPQQAPVENATADSWYFTI